MNLRRIIEHIKNQQWTAVAIDFVIVVVGVFVGIQVSNWNQARVTDQQAAAFTSDETLLVSAYRATQYKNKLRRRATYDELVSTGTIGLIADRSLRAIVKEEP